MPNFNKVFLMGNMTRDPELRYTPSGTAVCEFSIAVNRNWKSGDGEMREETCFVDCTMWGRRGEVVAEYFSKGKPIFIEGRLQLDQWESREGEKRSKLKVVAESFEFLAGRGEGGDQSGGARPSRQRADRPAPRRQPDEVPPQQQNEGGFAVQDDDIPF